MKNRIERIRKLAAELTEATTEATREITVAHKRAQRSLEHARQSGNARVLERADGDYTEEVQRVIADLHRKELKLLCGYIADVQDSVFVSPPIGEEE